MIRPALLMALACTAAIALWMIGRLALGEAAYPTGLAVARASLVTQCIMAVYLGPWLASDSQSIEWAGAMALITVPWPLLILAVKFSGISSVSMVGSQIWVASMIILSCLGARVLMRVFAEDQRRIIAFTVLQCIPATLLWAGHRTWLGWFIG